MTYEEKHGIYGSIYRLVSPSGKSYVGQTTQLDIRIPDYQRLDKEKDQPKIYRAIAKYGWENFKVQILCHCFDKEDLDAREIHCIAIFDCVKNGYNCLSGGANGKHSEETRKKMSESAKRKPPMTKETKQKLSKAFKGRKISEEQKKKLSIARTGQKLSGAGLESFRKWKAAHPMTEETKKKMKDLSKKGSESPRYDKSIHLFKNRETNETFKGTKYDFRTKFNIPYQDVTALFFRGRKSARNWILLDKNLKE